MRRLYAGIDLHSNNNVVVITDESDTVVYRKRKRNDLRAVLEALAPFAGQLEGVVVELTYNWYWLVDGLMAEGYRVHLANTNALKQYSGLKYSDDDTDPRLSYHHFTLGVELFFSLCRINPLWEQPDPHQRGFFFPLIRLSGLLRRLESVLLVGALCAGLGFPEKL